MALSTQAQVLAKRRVGNYITGFAKPFLRQTFQMLFSWLSQFTAGADLQVSEFATLTSTDVVLADAACTLYALAFIKATATACFFKGTNHATTCSTDGTQDISIRHNKVGESALIFAQGLTLSAGLTVQCNTTGTGATGSGANGVKGFALIGS